ncbi:MAG: hypothetical protein JO341_10405 [Gammaproteobacteria bacterium]|nr:hypothetical protein [Gammaproteobacteria bacterium]
MLRPAFLALLAAFSAPLAAFTVNIAAGTPRMVFLQVGLGSFNGLYDNGGTPLNNTTINKVSVTVPAAAVGNGTAQAMTTDSAQAHSFWDNYVFCNPPQELYIGGFYRATNNGTGTVLVSATVPTALVDGAGDTLSFGKVSWTSRGNGDGNIAQPFPAGTFNAGTVQTIGTIGQNQWAESCWTFSYKNDSVTAAGTYTGRVLYTLTAP